MQEFAFQFRLENKSDQILLRQPPQGMLFDISNSIQPSDDDMILYMDMMHFISGVLKSNVTCLIISMDEVFLKSMDNQMVLSLF